MAKHLAATALHRTKRQRMIRTWNLSARGNTMSAPGVTGVEVQRTGEMRRHVFPTMSPASCIDRPSSAPQRVWTAALGGLLHPAGHDPAEPCSIAVARDVRQYGRTVQNGASAQDRGSGNTLQVEFTTVEPGSVRPIHCPDDDKRPTNPRPICGWHEAGVHPEKTARVTVHIPTCCHSRGQEASQQRAMPGREPCEALDIRTSEAASTHDTAKVTD